MSTIAIPELRTLFQASNNPLAMPLPPGETLLPHIEAEPWLCIDTHDVFLKGIAFNRANELIVMAAYPGDEDKSMAGRVHRTLLHIDSRKEINPLINVNGLRISNHAIHKDGRIFIASITGELLVANADGTDLRPIAAKWNTKPEKPIDLAFDSNGYLYVTDFIGYAGNPKGGIYRWSPDMDEVEQLLPNLVTPNGIAFSPDEHTIWLSCSWANELVAVSLSPTRKSVQKAAVMYHLSGPPGSDGIKVDVRGNVYLAMNFQGRVLILNHYGIPIANVLLPGRDHGKLIRTSNLCFKPGTDEVYIVASAETGGAWIYRFHGLAEGAPLYSHQ